MNFDPQAALNVVTPLLYAFGVGAIVLESIYIVWNQIRRDRRSRWLSVKCGILAFGAEGLLQTTALFAIHMWVYQYRVFDLGFVWWAWLLTFLVNDLMFYVSHRAQHENRLLWAIHVVHHSPRHYDLTTGIRGSALGTLAGFPFVVWIPLLGIHPLMYLLADKLFKFYGLAYHTEAVHKLGWMDSILVTPANHRVHHATNPQYIDRNYGGFFILFDRCLGTFEPEVETPEYGLVKDWHGYGLVDCQTHELRDLWRDVCSASNWGDSWRYLYKAPGWKPSGSPSPVA